MTAHETVPHAAALVIERHLDGWCPQCPPAGPAGCRLLEWARLTIAVVLTPSEPKL